MSYEISSTTTTTPSLNFFFFFSSSLASLWLRTLTRVQRGVGLNQGQEILRQTTLPSTRMDWEEKTFPSPFPFSYLFSFYPSAPSNTFILCLPEFWGMNRGPKGDRWAKVAWNDLESRGLTPGRAKALSRWRRRLPPRSQLFNVHVSIDIPSQNFSLNFPTTLFLTRFLINFQLI